MKSALVLHEVTAYARAGGESADEPVHHAPRDRSLRTLTDVSRGGSPASRPHPPEALFP